MRLVARWVFAFALISVSARASMFEAGKHCVGYKFKKKSLSLFSGQVAAKNCDVSAQLLPVVGGGYQIEVSVPISAFDSGDGDWDQELRDILKEADQPDILFHSKVMSEKEWKKLAQKPKVTLDGELSIANKTYPISAPCQLTKVSEGIEVDGVTSVPFSKLDVQPPKGFIVKADSDLEIHFHLVSDKILGADRLFTAPEKDKDIIKDAMKGVEDQDGDEDNTAPAPQPPLDNTADKVKEKVKEKPNQPTEIENKNTVETKTTKDSI